MCFSQQLLKQIQKVNITVKDTHVYFDANGDPSLGYDIVYWNTAASKQGANIETIGEYWPDRDIQIPHDLVVSKASVMVRLEMDRQHGDFSSALADLMFLCSCHRLPLPTALKRAGRDRS